MVESTVLLLNQHPKVHGVGFKARNISSILGVKLCEVYEAAVSVVKKAKPDLVEKMTKSVG